MEQVRPVRPRADQYYEKNKLINVNLLCSIQWSSINDKRKCLMMLEYDKLYLGDLEDYFNFRPNQSNLASKTSARGANIVECILELKISIHLNLHTYVTKITHW